MKCPACNNTRKNRQVGPSSWVYECGKCGAIFGDHLYLGDSYNYVLPYWATDAELSSTRPEDLRYYDLTCLGSKGIERRHGWFNPQTKRIHQVG